MKKEKHIAVVGIMLSLCTISVHATQPDSAQQALQQLRILQQRMTNQSGSQPATGAAPGGNAGASSGAVATSIAQQGPQLSTSGLAPPAIAAGPPSVPPVSALMPADNTGDQSPVPVAGTTNNVPLIASNVDNTVLDSQAFEGVTRQLFPLSPGEIIQLKQMNNTTVFASESPVGVPPKPTATSQIVNLSPGSTPPVIRLAQGFVSSLVFLDSTGAPWPISAYDLGDPSSFNIQWDKTSNTLMIQALKQYNYGNLAVRLRDLNTPVMLTLIPGQKAVDYRVDLRIQGYGPNAKTLPLEEGLPPSASDLLLHVLDGVPPPGSERLIVSGGDARAWAIEEKMYVRTSLTVLSPGWIASMTSADGTHAYEMQKSPVLLVSWHGKVMQLKVEGL